MSSTPSLPPITLHNADFDQLDQLVATSTNPNIAQVVDYLERELNRATVVSVEEIAADIVTMYATVTYTDNKSAQERTVTLVYPHETDIDAGKISVMTPIGAALIGMQAGQTIEWHSPLGRDQSLTVTRVVHPPFKNHG